MQNFKQSLDDYISKEPADDGFDLFCEKVSDFYDDNIIKDDEFFCGDIEFKWLNKLYDMIVYVDIDEKHNPKTLGYITPEKAAKIISRAYYIFKLNKK